MWQNMFPTKKKIAGQNNTEHKNTAPNVTASNFCEKKNGASDIRFSRNTNREKKI